MSTRTVVVPTADILLLLLGNEDDCGKAGLDIAKEEPDGVVRSTCSKSTICTQSKPVHQETSQEHEYGKFTLKADAVRDGPGYEQRQKSRQHKVSSSSSSSSSFSQYECYTSGLQYSFSQTVEHEEQQDYTADDVRIIARCINNAVAKLELESASHSVTLTSVMSPFISAISHLHTVTQSLNTAMERFSINDQFAFLVLLGRSLIAKCKESTEVIRSYIQQYATSRFGARIRVPITSKDGMSSDGTTIH